MSKELHDRLTNEFIQGAMRQMLKEGGSHDEAMVMLESLIMSFMLIGTKAFKVEPQVSAVLVDEAVHRAMERFAQQMRKP